MSIIFKSQTKQLSAKGYTGQLSYTEGNIRIPLPIIEFKNHLAYTEELTFTFTLDNTSGFLLDLKSEPSSRANTVGLVKNGDEYTLSGVNWKFLKEHLETLYVETHDDMDSDFTVDVRISDGVTNPLTGQFVYTANAVIDNIADLNYPSNRQIEINTLPLEVEYNRGTPLEVTKPLLINDQNGPYTTKKYEVVVSSVPDAIAGYSDLNNRLNITGCGAGHLFKTTNLVEFNLVQRFNPEIIETDGKFGSKVETSFNPEMNISFYGNAGESYTVNNDKCIMDRWDKTGDLDFQEGEPNRKSVYNGEHYTLIQGYPDLDIVLVEDSAFSETVSLTGYDTSPGDLFGHAIHLSENGKLLFVTAPNDTHINKGTIYVFRRFNNPESDLKLPEDGCGIGTAVNATVSWKQVASWDAPELIDNTRFGINLKVIDKTGDKSMCIAPVMGEYVFVSTEEPDKSGLIHVYRTNDELNWIHVSTLTSDQPTENALFGFDFAVDAFRDSNNDQITEMYVSVGEPNANLGINYTTDNANNLTITGEQNRVNRALKEVEYYINQGIGKYDLVFTQNVIAGNKFTPYTQEQITVPITVIEGMTVSETVIYNEDEVLLFTPAQFDLDLVPDSKTYEIQFITSDPNFGYINSSNLVGTPSELNVKLTDMVVIPAADYTGIFTLDLRLLNLTDNIDHGRTTISFVVDKTHDEFEVNTPITYDEHTVLTFSPGQITDKRADIQAQYPQSDLYEAYVINLDKTVLDDFDLAIVEPEDGDFEDMFVAEVINIPSNAFHVPLYNVTLTLSDPAAGVITPSVITGTKEVVNAQLLSIDFTPSVDYVQDFEVIYTQRQTTDGVSQGSDVINVNIANTDADGGYTVNQGPYNWALGSNTKLANFAIITDSAGDVATVSHRVIVELDAPASDANGQIRSFGTGGTSVWDDVSTLTIEGTRQEVQSHLDSIEWWSRGPTDAFTCNTTLYRQIDAGAFDIIRNVENVVFNEGQVLPSPVNTNINRLYDEDVKTNFDNESKTS